MNDVTPISKKRELDEAEKQALADRDESERIADLAQALHKAFDSDLQRMLELINSPVAQVTAAEHMNAGFCTILNYFAVLQIKLDDLITEVNTLKGKA